MHEHWNKYIFTAENEKHNPASARRKAWRFSAGSFKMGKRSVRFGCEVVDSCGDNKQVDSALYIMKLF